MLLSVKCRLDSDLQVTEGGAGLERDAGRRLESCLCRLVACPLLGLTFVGQTLLVERMD